MYCKYCGKELPDNVRHCTDCGKELAKPNDLTNNNSASIIPFILILTLSALLPFVRVALLGSPLSVAGASQIAVGLVITIFLSLRGKIAVRRVTYGDLIFPVCLYLFLAVPTIIQYYSFYYLSSDHVFAAAIVFSIEGSYALETLWSWILLNVFLMIRSGSLTITKRKTAVVTGVLLLWSLAFAMLVPALAGSVGAAQGMLYFAVEMGRPYFLLMWLRRLVTLSFAVLCGRQVLRMAGRMVFTMIVVLAAVLFSLALMLWLNLGASGAALAPTLAYGAGGVMLLVAGKIEKSNQGEG